MKDEMTLEYNAPDPVELRDFSEPTCARSSETYWRWGYQIGGGNPVMADQYARTEKQASALASRRALDVADRLKNLHAPAEVNWWTQRWHIETVVEYSESIVTPL